MEQKFYDGTHGLCVGGGQDWQDPLSTIKGHMLGRFWLCSHLQIGVYLKREVTSSQFLVHVAALIDHLEAMIVQPLII